MKRFFGTALLVCVVAVGAYAVDDKQPQPKAISRESTEYLQKLRKRTPFGAKDFDLAALRAGMGSRREPKGKDTKLIRVKIGDIPCE